MAYYGCLWVVMGIMVTSSTKMDNMTSDSFLKIWIFQNFQKFQNFSTSNDLKIKWNPGYIRLYPVQSGQIQLNPVDFDIKTDVLKCFWRTKFILSGILAEILSIFFIEKFPSISFEIFLKFCFHKMSHYWVNMSGPESVFYFNKFKNISSICPILWSHLNKSFLLLILGNRRDVLLFYPYQKTEFRPILPT